LYPNNIILKKKYLMTIDYEKIV